MTPLRALLVLSLLLTGLAGGCAAAADDRLVVMQLRCEGLENPLGVDAQPPRLSWTLASGARGQKQTAYRILVASRPQLLESEKGDLWDSGKISGDRANLVSYQGKPLVSQQRCFWKVMSWDMLGRASEWSQAGSWSMGLLRPEDWKAEWISHRDSTPLHKDRNSLYLPPPRHYRKQFALPDKPIQRATAYLSALGIADLYVNAARPATDAYFMPGWSDYARRAYYRAIDVTGSLRPGENTLGAVLAEGWYSGYVGYGLLVGYGPNKVGRYFYGKTPALLMQVEVEFADGSRQTIVTDTSWKVTDQGPWREADMIMGEAYDARAVLPWMEVGFDASAWENAIRAEENGSTKAIFSDNRGSREVELGFQKPRVLQAYAAPPIVATEEVKAVALSEYKPGIWIFDLGQNIAGVVRLKLQGPAGTQVQIRYGEMIHPDGRLMTENLRRARATDYYTLRGDSAGETWQPRFTYHGFRYVELTGMPAKPQLDAVTGIVLHNDTPLTSSFECSDPVINRLFKNVVWTQRANFIEVPTDCPQRDERLGWMGDAQIYVRTATYNADVLAFFTKWLDDLEEAQLPNGAYPDYAPYPMSHGEPGKSFGTAWTDAGIIVPWTIWQVYGDTRIIERHYASMQRFIDFRRKASPDLRGVSIGNTWGDWLNLNSPTPIEYIDACYFAYSSKLMGDMAEAIGRMDTADEYRKLFTDIRARFNADYVNADGSLKVDTQTAYVLALSFGLLPDELVRPAADRLADLIAKNDYRMATGFLGTKPLLPVLSANGHHDLAVRLFQSRRFPSWGYEVENGATTIWERWDSYTKEDAFGRHNAAMNSFSHYSFGAVCEWMFRSLAGIDTNGPGFRNLIIRPGPPSLRSNPEQKPIEWVRAHYDSPSGRITTQWRQEQGRFELTITIPANTTAKVYIPASKSHVVTESGQPVEQVRGIEVLGWEGDRLVLRVGSGGYAFVSAIRPRT